MMETEKKDRKKERSTRWYDSVWQKLVRKWLKYKFMRCLPMKLLKMTTRYLSAAWPMSIALKQIGFFDCYQCFFFRNLRKPFWMGKKADTQNMLTLTYIHITITYIHTIVFWRYSYEAQMDDQILKPQLLDVHENLRWCPRMLRHPPCVGWSFQPWRVCARNEQFQAGWGSCNTWGASCKGS